MEKIYERGFDVIAVGKLNETFLQLSCDKHVAYELNEYFSFLVPNAQFHPKVKARMWDGKIRLFNIQTGQLYFGLLPYLKEWAEKHSYKMQTDIVEARHLKEGDINKIKEFFDSLNLHCKGEPITPRDYQIASFLHCVKSDRTLLLSPTSSGKSLVIYSLIRWYQKFLDDDKMLIVVPTTNLVSQMFGDFKEYSQQDKDWNVYDECHKIYSGREKDSNQQIYISTWQSLYRLPKKYFEQFSVIVGDEAHLATATSLKNILERSTACRYRFGTTGTLTDSKTHKLVLEGLFGKTYTAVTSKELMDDKHISKLNIQCLQLQYPEEERKFMKSASYAEEIAYIVAHKRRNNFLCNLALDQKGNTLILFNFIELHGKVLLKLLKEKDSKRKVYFIAGETDVEQREAIRKATEEEKNAIIVASSGVLSTGVNIRNLQSLIFAHPFKAKVRNLQSIGRVLRLDDKNNKAVLYDIIDDLHWKKRDNYGLKHWKERLNIYLKEKFDYEYNLIPL